MKNGSVCAAGRDARLSLERYFCRSILADAAADEELTAAVGKNCGIGDGDAVAVFMISLGEHYHRDCEAVTSLLDSYMGKAGDYAFMQIQSGCFHVVIVILYRMTDPERIRLRLERTVQPVFGKFLRDMPVFSWATNCGLKGLPSAFFSGLEIRSWNLCRPKGTLLMAGFTDCEKTIPFQYPMIVENHLKRAVVGRNREEFLRLLTDISFEFMTGGYRPEDVREACVRFCLAILNQARAIDRVPRGIRTQEILGGIVRALTWEEILKEMADLYARLEFPADEQEDVSILIRRARKLIEEYYSHGVTLGRIAQRLGVSEEYLSSLFKKETGRTFKETVRRCQITHVKELLIQSDLKLNQIADATGYADAKYMSRVFRDETGMSPAEFRMKNR